MHVSFIASTIRLNPAAQVIYPCFVRTFPSVGKKLTVEIVTLAGVSMWVSEDSGSCAGPACLSNWTKFGAVLTSQPEEFARVGDPARPWKARDGHWYQIVGASVKGVAGHGALYLLWGKYMPSQILQLAPASGIIHKFIC